MAERIICDICGKTIPLHGHYVVRIDVFADPSMPQLSGDELAEMSLDQAMAELIEQMKHLSAEELQDQVHRRFEYRLCRPCQMRFIANPLGKPRTLRPGGN
jgi:hypothetical protein